MNFFRKFGPGLLVTAAFIGPGTVTTASKAGAEFGFSLLWAVLFALVATIVLQEMAARLGIVSRLRLGDAIRQTLRQPMGRALAASLILIAIAFGNAAYQTGNITGAAMGLSVLADHPIWVWSLVVGGLAFLLLASGWYRLIEGVLVALVVLMSVVFLTTACIVRPDVLAVLRGMCIPTVPDGSLLTVIGLIGTTVVPYNLFLHASSVQEKWSADIPVPKALREARLDAVFSIGLGGMVTMAIIVTAAVAFHGRENITSAADMARQLEPVLGGTLAKIFFASGLLAAGVTSAITAPLAAAYATSGVLDWPRDMKNWRFRGVWMLILVLGVVAAIVLGKSPTQTILIAQVANGLLLPLLAAFLLLVVNQPQLMGTYRNRLPANIAGGVVILVTLGLGVFKIAREFGLV